MSQASKKSALGLMLSIAVAFLLAKAFWVFLETKMLPKQGINKEENSGIKALYYRYSLASKKDKPKVIKKPIQKSKTAVVKPKKPKELELKKFTLKGIYIDSKQKFIMVSYLGKTTFLSKGDELKGFKLIKIAPTYAIFSKDGKKYRLDLFKKEKNKEQSSKSSTNTLENTKRAEKKEPTSNSAITKDGDVTVISKELFNKYKKDINAIRKNINAVPIQDGKKLKGFRVTYVKKGSDFDKLGVKRGDIIKAINGEEITDWSVPISFFENIDTVNGATITVQRGNEIKELEYEVR